MSNSNLFQPLKVGNVTLQHRLVMAPLTRFRADKNHVPLPFVKEYYAQRASVPGTLLITEATFISRQAGGFPNIPGIWNQEQIAAWKEVTAAVRAKGSFIYLQLWAIGRAAYPDVAEAEGIVIKSASPVALDQYPAPQEMTISDINSFIADYVQAARNAIEAGFDGVELHGANGFLIDQFNQDRTNRRKDSYGGSVENRARFIIEAATAIVKAIGAEKVGVRLSPFSTYQGMRMDDPIPQFTYIIKEISKLKLAYLHLITARVAGILGEVDQEGDIRFAVDAWDKTSPVLLAGGYQPEQAKEAVDDEFRDVEAAVVFGRYFISTPDLPYRVKKGLPLAPYKRETFYTPESKEGYVDYPFSDEWISEHSL